MSKLITISDITGKGLIFPLSINDKGSVVAAWGLDLIKASIKNTISFLLGTRYFLGEFGTNIPNLIGNPNDAITQSLVEHQLDEQLPQWDKRFKILEVRVDNPNNDESKLNISLSIQINNTDIKETFIFPFYQNLIY